MEFIHLISNLRQRLLSPLPGAAAHDQMRAVPDNVARARYPHTELPRPGSVLILLHEREGEVCFPLIRRTDYAGAHSGQISLPGGKQERNETTEQTALRETREEIGIHPESVEIIGSLSPLHVIPSNFLVLPVIGLCRLPVEYEIDHREVVCVLECPVTVLTAPKTRQSAAVEVGQDRFNAPAFLVNGQIVWGATAMIINEFRCLLRESGW